MDPTPVPPEVQNVGQKAAAGAKSIWAWSQAHTVATAIILGLAVGFLMGKLL